MLYDDRVEGLAGREVQGRRADRRAHDRRGRQGPGRRGRRGQGPGHRRARERRGGGGRSPTSSTRCASRSATRSRRTRWPTPDIEAVIFDWGGTLTPWHTIDFARGGPGAGGGRGRGRTRPPPSALRAGRRRGLGPLARPPHQRDGRRHLPRGRADPRRGAAERLPRLLGAAHLHRPGRACRCSAGSRSTGSRSACSPTPCGRGSGTRSSSGRDGVLELLDGAVYTSEIPWTKPAPQAFLAAMEAVGVDRPGAPASSSATGSSTTSGAPRNAGMRTIHVPHSDIPPAQVGHTEGEPDAVADQLGHVYDVVAAWRSSRGLSAAAPAPARSGTCANLHKILLPRPSPAGDLQAGSRPSGQRSRISDLPKDTHP